MRKNRLEIIIAAALLIISGCRHDESAANSKAAVRDDRAVRLEAIKDSIIPFFAPMSVREGDWLDSHAEDGELFTEYVDSHPTLPTAHRNTIVIQPIGTFTPEQQKVITSSAEYMKVFFGLKVRLERPRPLGNVPAELTRARYRNIQIRTSYFLDTLLPEILPPDAAAFLCFTNRDLYPEETWNFVFGQANLENRVGVWSLYRLNDNSPKSTKFLDRTLKIAAHETGHMFSMRHCTKYECLMSGINHLDETDRRPLDVCPECMAKIAWAMNYEPVVRYRNLAQFWKSERRFDLERENIAMAGALEQSGR